MQQTMSILYQEYSGSLASGWSPGDFVVLKFFTAGFLPQNNAKPSLGSQSKIFVERSDHIKTTPVDNE